MSGQQSALQARVRAVLENAFVGSGVNGSVVIDEVLQLLQAQIDQLDQNRTEWATRALSAEGTVQRVRALVLPLSLVGDRTAASVVSILEGAQVNLPLSARESS